VSAALVIMAKTPTAGRSKTRLCPPCSPEQAADLAAAALRDTIDAARRSRASRRVLAMDVPSPEWTCSGFDVVQQRGDGLAERLAAVVRDVDEPLVLVGMDTPQVTATQLDAMLAAAADETGAQLGPALDGGWWAIGLPVPCAEVFADVPMSRPDTGRRQIESLRRHFPSVRTLPELRDVDHWADALEVARTAPNTRFARAVARVALQAEVAEP
jgi:glycosyltransferase A (GT-A) superfamily protein (DUF2064 family)